MYICLGGSSRETGPEPGRGTFRAHRLAGRRLGARRSAPRGRPEDRHATQPRRARPAVREVLRLRLGGADTGDAHRTGELREGSPPAQGKGGHGARQGRLPAGVPVPQEAHRELPPGDGSQRHHHPHLAQERARRGGRVHPAGRRDEKGGNHALHRNRALPERQGEVRLYPAQARLRGRKGDNRELGGAGQRLLQLPAHQAREHLFLPLGGGGRHLGRSRPPGIRTERQAALPARLRARVPRPGERRHQGTHHRNAAQGTAYRGRSHAEDARRGGLLEAAQPVDAGEIEGRSLRRVLPRAARLRRPGVPGGLSAHAGGHDRSGPVL